MSLESFQGLSAELENAPPQKGRLEMESQFTHCTYVAFVSLDKTEIYIIRLIQYYTCPLSFTRPLSPNYFVCQSGFLLSKKYVELLYMLPAAD